MADIANLAIQDGKATPLTHTFYPLKSGMDAAWRTSDSALPLIGQETVNARIKRLPSGINVVTLTLDGPALETATGANSSGYTAAPKVGYVNRVKVEFMLPDRGLSSQRKDLRVLLIDLLSEVNIVDIVDNILPPT